MRKPRDHEASAASACIKVRVASHGVVTRDGAGASRERGANAGRPGMQRPRERPGAAARLCSEQRRGRRARAAAPSAGAPTCALACCPNSPCVTQPPCDSAACRAANQPARAVQILLDDGGTRTSVPVAGDDTVRELKLQLAKGGWFTSKHCLFFGDRELLDHQHVADVMAAVRRGGSSRYLHVFVRTSDVRAGHLTMGSQSLSFGHLPDLADEPPCALPERAEAREVVPAAPAAAASAVIHVVIRKTAHVTWQPNAEGAFELLVQASDTAADVKQALLPAGAPCGPRILEDVALVHRGVCMDADRPLIEYGLTDGAQVELVPWRPTLARSPRAEGHTPPDLASPAHDLYVNWQKAASGLRAGAPDSALRWPEHQCSRSAASPRTHTHTHTRVRRDCARPRALRHGRQLLPARHGAQRGGSVQACGRGGRCEQQPARLPRHALGIARHHLRRLHAPRHPAGRGRAARDCGVPARPRPPRGGAPPLRLPKTAPAVESSPRCH